LRDQRVGYGGLSDQAPVDIVHGTVDDGRQGGRGEWRRRWWWRRRRRRQRRVLVFLQGRGNDSVQVDAQQPPWLAVSWNVDSREVEVTGRRPDQRSEGGTPRSGGGVAVEEGATAKVEMRPSHRHLFSPTTSAPAAGISEFRGPLGQLEDPVGVAGPRGVDEELHATLSLRENYGVCRPKVLKGGDDVLRVCGPT